MKDVIASVLGLAVLLQWLGCSSYEVAPDMGKVLSNAEPELKDASSIGYQIASNLYLANQFELSGYPKADVENDLIRLEVVRKELMPRYIQSVRNLSESTEAEIDLADATPVPQNNASQIRMSDVIAQVRAHTSYARLKPEEFTPGMVTEDFRTIARSAQSTQF